MPNVIPESRDEFMKLPIERQREVIEKMEFMSKPIEEQRKIVSQLEDSIKTGAFEAAARGIGQGITANTLDEMMGAAKAVPRVLKGEPFGEAYEQETENVRRGFRKAERDRPFITGASEAVGAVIPTLLAPASAIPRTLMGRMGAGITLGGLAGAGKAEEGIGSDEFRHSVKKGMAGGALGQAGFGVGKFVLGKTGKLAGGLSRAIGAGVGKAEKAGFIPKIMVGVAKKQIPKTMAKGFDKTIKLMEANELPAEQASKLMQGLSGGGAGLATAYINLINSDVEFARKVESGKVEPMPPGKLGDLIPREFTEKNKSTMSGRIQAGLDELIGAEEIGLDPGEKRPESQPNEDDRAALSLVPFFAGITKKVTTLDPEKIKELLAKKGKKLSGVDEERLRILNKPGMSQERKDKLIDKINQGIEGKDDVSNLGDVEIKRNRRNRSVWRDTKKSYDRIIDFMPPNKYFKMEEAIQKKYPGNPTKMGYDERLEWIAKTMSGDIKRAALSALKRHKFFMENPKLAEEMSNIKNRLDLVDDKKRTKLLERLDVIEDQILEFKMPDTKEMANARKKLESLAKDLPFGKEELDKIADNNYSLYRKLRDLTGDITKADVEKVSASKLSQLKKKKAEAMKEYQDWAKKEKILGEAYKNDKYKTPPSGGGEFGNEIKLIPGGDKGIRTERLRKLRSELEDLGNRSELDQEHLNILGQMPKATKEQLLDFRKNLMDNKQTYKSIPNDYKHLMKAIDYWLLKKGE